MNNLLYKYIYIYINKINKAQFSWVLKKIYQSVVGLPNSLINFVWPSLHPNNCSSSYGTVPVHLNFPMSFDTFHFGQGQTDPACVKAI